MIFEDESKLGKLGEHAFSMWCSSVGLTANKSSDDDVKGWDHLVEFPYIKTSLPRDKQQSPIECKVQVKSTQGKLRRLGIKVSVLKRLIDYSYPAFILFLEYSKGDEPILENSFLVHIDVDIIAKVLKTIRQNDIKKKPKQLNEIKTTISYNLSHKLSENTGGAFRQRALGFIPDADVDKYQDFKRNFVKTVGYESGAYVMKFQANPDEFEKYVTERVIGLTKSMSVTNSVLFDDRFNLKNESFELVRTQFADISLEPDVRERCKLIFFTDEHTLPISFDAEVVFAPSFKEKRNRMFLRANLFCIELAFKSENINNLSLTEIEISSSLYLTDTKATEIDEILNFFRLYNAFNLFGNVSCDIHFVKSGQHLQLKVGVIHEFPCTKNLVESMECLKSKYRLDGRNITTIDDIYKDRNGISMLSCIVCNRTDEMNVKVNDIDKFSAGNKNIPFTIVIQLGAVAIGAVSLLYLEHIENNNFKVVRSEVVKTLIFNDGMPKREQLIEIEKQALNHLHD